ncbi:hypothetical protein SSAG_00273 [Streptomyces sp. Mg1]|nr:hypothetical protein SSAG_00273 [Streptomyces sp. Mg1]
MLSAWAVSYKMQVLPPWRTAFVTSSDTTKAPVSAASVAVAGRRRRPRKARAASWVYLSPASLKIYDGRSRHWVVWWLWFLS